LTVTLKDGTATSKGGGEADRESTVKIDPTTTPKSQDDLLTTGPDKGKTRLSIYEVKGDTYRVCIAAPDKPRPTAFESKEGSGHSLYTFKRAKPRD